MYHQEGMGALLGAQSAGHTGTSLALIQLMEITQWVSQELWQSWGSSTGSALLHISVFFFFARLRDPETVPAPPVCGALPRPGMGRVKLSRGSWFWQTLILGTSEHKIIITPFPGKKSPWTCVKLAACWLSHFCSCYVGQPGLLMYWTRSNIPSFSPCKETPGSQPASPGSLRMNLLTVMAKASCTPLWEGSRRTRQALMEKLQAGAHFPGMADSQQWELWDRGQHRVLRRR